MKQIAALLVMIALPSTLPAQHQNDTDARDFKMFIESLSVRRNARTCERGIADYGKVFAGLYRGWSETHRAQLYHGESVFNDALKTSDLKKYPFTNRTILVRADEALAELAKPPKTTGPITLDARTTAACERVLKFLKDP
jgi:hypothetical protein